MFKFDTQREAEDAVSAYRAHPGAPFKTADFHYHQTADGKWQARGLVVKTGHKFLLSAPARA